MKGKLLIEFKAAQLVMKGGNLEQSEFRDLIEKGRAFFWDGEKKDYGKCPYASKISEEYPGAFLACEASDLKRQAVLAEKSGNKGLLLPKNKIFAGETVKFASVAIRESLGCVLVPPTAIVDTIKICEAGAIKVMPLADFLQMLHDSAL